MIILCENCSKKFIVKDKDIPKEGREVQCGYCSSTWHQMPTSKPTRNLQQQIMSKPTAEVSESPSVDKIKASDGKNYRFLGSQWAELLPSGKTGLFARKKISQELDEITGRKEKKITKRKQKKIEEVDPSSENFENKKQTPHHKKEGLGFLGYIFLLIIIGFSFIGILKTFENDLIDYMPEIVYVFELLNEQLEYISESVKNLIVLTQDLINSY